MKGVFSIAFSLALLAPAAIAVEFEERGKSRWVVGFHDMPDLAPGDELHGGTVVGVTPALRFVTVETNDLSAFRVRATLDENVRYVEADASDHKLLFTPNDYFWNHASNWGVKKIGAEAAWDRTLGSTAVKDGHLDSGIVATHEDISGSRFLQGYDYYYGDATPQDESGCNWHGSHTTGTVAATINNGKGFAGMAQVTVLPVKIFGGAGCWAASTTNLANAIKYVGDQGSHVSSNSWGGGAFSTAIHDAITYSTNLGVIFVASSGNGACSNCVGNPWVQQAANTIIVTATDSNDAGASFNSKGPQVDVSAPGVYVGSAGGPGNSYYIMDGTSMAAPHVTGLVGLLKTLNPTWTRQQVTDRITSTAVDLGAPGHDETFGWGRIDADAATAGGSPPAPQCSDGIDNDGDGLTDFPADPGCVDANDNDEYDAPPPGDVMHVGALNGWSTHSGSKHTLHCEAVIHDAGGAAVSGATVTMKITRTNGVSSTYTGDTDASGAAEFTRGNGRAHGTAWCEVLDVAKAGWTYDPASNVATVISFSVT